VVNLGKKKLVSSKRSHHTSKLITSVKVCQIQSLSDRDFRLGLWMAMNFSIIDQPIKRLSTVTEAKLLNFVLPSALSTLSMMIWEVT